METQEWGCGLAAACMRYFGKGKACYELQTLRAFRDTYMQQTEEGGALVKAYYEIAPTLVGKIDASNMRGRLYGRVFETLAYCVRDIEADKNEEAREAYRALVENLQSELLTAQS